MRNSFVIEEIDFTKRGECCIAMETTSVAFEIRVKNEFRLLNEFYKNIITLLALKFIYKRNKFIVEIGRLPGCDSLSLRKYFLPRRSFMVPSASGSSSQVILR
jgi:hypothetical protein